MSFLLDEFPIEIFHMIFNYLWTHEILYSFGHITTYINNVLSSYDNYKINFESIRKSYFDLVCRYMKPDQVVSLILSGKKDTPNQIELFQSLFSMEQFTRLRALKLIELDDIDDTFIFDMYKLQHIVSLEVDVEHRSPFLVPLTSLERLIINIPPRIQTDIDPAITYIRYEQLRQLTLSNCSCEQFQKIFHRAIQLVSLKISFVFLDPNDITILANFHQEKSTKPPLISLSLSIKSCAGPITRNHIENFLTPLQRLRRLELIILFDAKRSLLDGYKWETFLTKQLSKLVTFNFNLSAGIGNENLLVPFRRPFWLDKHWYVACHEDYSRLFTVPYFARSSMDNSTVPISSDYTTLPIEKHIILYDHVTQLRIDSDECQFPYRYNYVKKLFLDHYLLPDNVLDLTKVQEFIVNSSDWSYYKVLKLIKNKMPGVYSLTLNCKYTSKRYQNLPIISLEQIRVLNLPEYSNDSSLNWSRFFPSVERLKVKINSRNQIPLLIDQFQNMFSGYFYTDLTDTNKSIKITHQWLSKHTNRLRGKNSENFTCQINDQFRYMFSLCLWIGESHEVKKIPNGRWWDRCFA